MTPSNDNNNNNNNKDNNKPSNPLQRKRKDSLKATTTTGGEQLYHPSIFRYNCRGKLDVTTTTPNSAGTCWGVQSQLEHVDHWRLVTRQEAIQVFSQQASGGPEDALPAGNDAAAAHALSTTLLSQVLIYSQPTSDNSKDDDVVDDHNNIVKVKPTLSPDEEMISRQDWTCYGNSDIDLLVLRPQGEKEEEIVAVAPYCSPGLSVRDMSGDVGNDRTSTLRLGFLEVVYQSATPRLDDDTDNNTENTTTLHQDQNAVKEPKQQMMMTQEAVTAAAGSYAGKFYDSSLKIIMNMNANANLLADSVKEDFPQRTYQASQRIVGEFGKTVEGSTSLMKKLQQLWDDSDNNDDDNNDKK